MALKFNKAFSINKVVKRLVYTILALYVGGTVMAVFGQVMSNTSSAFYQGLNLIGWTIGTTAASCTARSATLGYPCILDYTGTGVLSVIGIIGIAGVVLEFVSFN